MLIVKPYGTTKTGPDVRTDAVRKIHPNAFREDAQEIESFATSHAKLVLAQWISLIDKVITKPAKGAPPSLAQMNLREEVGVAAWNIIIAKGLMDAPSNRLKRLEREWWSRIHPYDRECEPTGIMDFRGRWFATFSKEHDATKVDGTALAKTLYEHLYENERRMGKDSSARRVGLIEARANSIARNVLKAPKAAIPLQRPWTDDDISRFSAGPDLMMSVREALKKHEGQREARTRQSIGAKMNRHYGRIFARSDGQVPNANEAMQTHPGLFALHSAAKDRFKLLLRTPQVYWLKKFPGSTSGLINELEESWRNRAVSDLVRLGKIIHYEAAPPGQPDSPAHVLTNWPKSVSKSFFWSSDGQTRIKQNEAFVRVWRHVLSFASRTITNWADPSGDIARDILGARERDKAIKNLTCEVFDRPTEVIFGRAATLIRGSDLGSRQAVMALGLTGLSRLRNAVFHFSGVSSFLKALDGLESETDPYALIALRTLFIDDQQALSNRLSDDLRSVNADYYLSQQQLDQFLASLNASGSSHDGLPDFQKVLGRGQSAFLWRKVDMRLPPPATHGDVDDQSKNCRHFLLRLLYERSFVAWLSNFSTETLREMVDQYITRTTNEARRISGDDKLIARANGRIKILDGDSVFDLFAMLRSATTSEARDQRHRGIETRDFSKYLRDLELDLIAQAFQLFIETQHLDWLFGLEGRKPTEKRQSEVPGNKATVTMDAAKDWQAVLYFILHLVPVDEINKLAHQISRTSIREAEHAEVASPLLAVLHLYERSHDAKFSGLEGSRDHEALRALFENKTVADAVLKGDQVGLFSARGSVRAIREMLRFTPPVHFINSLASVPITAGHIERFNSLSPGIATAQETRSALHKKWIEQGHRLSETDHLEYRKCMYTITHYRDVSRHIKMTNHLDAYRLLIAALAKLVDFSGMWERDLYFVTMALVYQIGASPSDVFRESRGRYPLETGQIIDALRNHENDDKANLLLDQVAMLFGIDFRVQGQARIKTRNYLAHFEVLRKGSAPIALTDLVNRTRGLLSYDKKLSNAVSKSMIDIFERFGLRLEWEAGGGMLCNAHIEAEQLLHLRRADLTEPRVGREFVSLAKTFK